MNLQKQCYTNSNRPEIILRDLNEYFDLDGTFKITLNSDKNKGYLIINSIQILPSSPGIDDPGLFEGSYFQNIPIRVTAVPFTGFYFSHWEGTIHKNDKNPSIEFNSNEDIFLEPVFLKNN